MGSVLGTIGGAVGSYFGGPIGGAIGGALGGAIGGGGGGGSSGTPPTQRSTGSVPGWLGSVYQQQVGQANTLAGKAYDPAFNYQVAGFNPQQQQAFGLTNQLVGQYQQPYQQAMGNTAQLGNMAMGGLNNAAFQSYMNPYIQNVLDTSRQQQFQNYDLAENSLNDQAAASGAFGGSRYGLAQAQLSSNFLRDLNAQQANTLASGFNTALGGYQTGIGQGLSAANQLGSLATNQQNTGIAGINALYGMGREQQNLAQQQLTAGQQNALQAAQYPWQQLSNAQGVMAAPAQIYGRQTITQTPYTAPSWQQGLMGGLGMSGLGGFSGGSSLNPFANFLNSGNESTGQLLSQINSNPIGSESLTQGGLSGLWNSFTSLFNEGGVVPGYKKGGKVDASKLTNGVRTGGLLHKVPPMPKQLLGTMPEHREFGINGSYADGGAVASVPQAATLSGNMYSLGSLINQARAQNYVNQLLGTNPTALPEGYAKGGLVGYDDGGGVMDYLDSHYLQPAANALYNNYPNMANSIENLGQSFQNAGFNPQHPITSPLMPGNDWASQHPIASTTAAVGLPIDAIGGALAGGMGYGAEALTGAAGAYPAVTRGIIGAGALMEPSIAQNIANAPAREAQQKINDAKTEANATRVLQQKAAGLTKADEDFINNLHQTANGQPEEMVNAQPQGMTGPFGGQMNLPLLAGASNFFANAGGLKNQGLGFFGQGMLGQINQQKQLEAMSGYKQAMAQAALARGQSELGNLDLKRSMMPYQQQYEQAKIQAMLQNPYLHAEQIMTVRAGQLQQTPKYFSDPAGAMAEAQREFMSDPRAAAQMALSGGQGGGGPVSISSQQEWEQLPSGTPFIFTNSKGEQKPGTKQ